MILLISGSLRRDSYNTALLRCAEALLPESRWFDGIATLPHYSEDDDGEHESAAVAELRRAVAEADAVLLATPEYNGSIPGALKNAVDWVSRPFPDCAWRGKPVAVIGASTGLFGGIWAQADLRKCLRLAGARVLEAEFAVGGADEAFLPSGSLREPRGLHDVVSALVGAVDYASPKA